MNTESFLSTSPCSSYQGAELHPLHSQSSFNTPINSFLYPEQSKFLHTKSFSDRIGLSEHLNTQQLGYSSFAQNSHYRPRYPYTPDLSSQERELPDSRRNYRRNPYQYMEADKENMPNQHNINSNNYLVGLKRVNAGLENPLQDLTNECEMKQSYSDPTSTGFKSRAFNIESNYRGYTNKPIIARLSRREGEKFTDVSKDVPKPLPPKDVDMNFYSRPIVFDREINSNSSVVYSCEDSPNYQNVEQKENFDVDRKSAENNVNSIVGKKKPKSRILAQRRAEGLDIDTSYNSNAKALILPDDENGVSVKNLMQDNFTSRAGFFEMKRG